MAHYRKRYIEPWLKKLLGFSPLVGLIGHRQVGKTSLVERLGGFYVTFDRKELLEHATYKPEDFIAFMLNQKAPAIIDECQLCPPLFSALKEHVRVHKKPGQFVLTGSVRFTSRKAIKESLTGRIINIEVPPLGISEIFENPNPTFVRTLLEKGFASATRLALKLDPPKEFYSSFTKSSMYGGLPGVCFVRDAKLRSTKFESQLETILDRDLRLIFETTLPFSTLRRILVELANSVGEPLNLSDIQRRVRISPNTLKKMIYAFEALFLIQMIPAHDSAQRPLIFFTDSGEAMHLAQNRLTESQILSQTVFAQLKSILSSLWDTQHPIIQITHFSTRGGTFLPIVIGAGKSTYGVLPCDQSSTRSSLMAQANSFLTNTNASGVILLKEGATSTTTISERILEIPLPCLFM